MNTPQILVTGDYWHADFREPFSSLDAPATMVPLDRIDSVVGQEFFVIVLAQSRRDQFSQASVDAMRQQMPDTPIVVLMGTWCEGENRSGRPLAGVTRVPWNQWKTQFEKYCIQIFEGVPTDWHQPLTATVADRVRDFAPDPAFQELLLGKKVLVSAENVATFESLSDMLKVYQCMSFWAESDTVGIEAEEPCAMIVDGNGLSDDLKSRLESLNAKYGELPVVVLLNFPRKQCVESLSSLGIEEVVSKPFTHDDVLYSLSRVLGSRVATS